jgi:hypothetical protein
MVVEILQDAVVILLTLTLLALAFMFLWRVGPELVGSGAFRRDISNIIFVVTTVELY